jgi:hypothetical protein
MIAKKWVFVLILLLAVAAALFLLSGCTLGGLYFGSKIDRVNTDTTTVSLESLTYYIHPDTCEIVKGDYALIVLNSGQSLEGKVKEIDRGNTINLAVKPTQDYSKRVEVLWTEIQSISIIDKPVESRLLLTTLGAVIDIGVFLVLVYGKEITRAGHFSGL